MQWILKARVQYDLRRRYWQDSLTNNCSWQKKHLMPLSSCVQQQVEQGGRAGFWEYSGWPHWALFLAAAQQASPFPIPFALVLQQHQSHLLSAPPRFCWGPLEVTQHSRVLNSPGPLRKLVGLWSQRLLSGFVVEQINCKGNIFTPFCQKQGRKKEMNEWGTKML